MEQHKGDIRKNANIKSIKIRASWRKEWNNYIKEMTNRANKKEKKTPPCMKQPLVVVEAKCNIPEWTNLYHMYMDFAQSPSCNYLQSLDNYQVVESSMNAVKHNEHSLLPSVTTIDSLDTNWTKMWNLYMDFIKRKTYKREPRNAQENENPHNNQFDKVEHLVGTLQQQTKTKTKKRPRRKKKQLLGLEDECNALEWAHLHNLYIDFAQNQSSKYLEIFDNSQVVESSMNAVKHNENSLLPSVTTIDSLDTNWTKMWNLYMDFIKRKTYKREPRNAQENENPHNNQFDKVEHLVGTLQQQTETKTKKRPRRKKKQLLGLEDECNALEWAHLHNLYIDFAQNQSSKYLEIFDNSQVVESSMNAVKHNENSLLPSVTTIDSLDTNWTKMWNLYMDFIKRKTYKREPRNAQENENPHNNQFDKVEHLVGTLQQQTETKTKKRPRRKKKQLLGLEDECNALEWAHLHNLYIDFAQNQSSKYLEIFDNSQVVESSMNAGKHNEHSLLPSVTTIDSLDTNWTKMWNLYMDFIKRKTYKRNPRWPSIHPPTDTSVLEHMSITEISETTYESHTNQYGQIVDTEFKLQTHLIVDEKSVPKYQHYQEPSIKTTKSKRRHKKRNLSNKLLQMDIKGNVKAEAILSHNQKASCNKKQPTKNAFISNPALNSSERKHQLIAVDAVRSKIFRIKEKISQARLNCKLHRQSDGDESIEIRKKCGSPKVQYVAIDCEMVVVGVSQQRRALARASLVDQEGRVLYDAFVKPLDVVTDYKTHISGIRPEDIANGEDFRKVQSQVSALMKDKIIVGHGLQHDLAVLELTHPLENIRDTSTYKPFRRYAKNGRTPGLKHITKAVLGQEIQTGEHSSVEDAQAAMKIYQSIRSAWENSIRKKMART